MTPTVYLVGDSTVQTGSGYGDYLAALLDNPTQRAENRGISGESSKSYYDLYWAALRAELLPGDTVMLQFGHNDQKVSQPDKYTTTGTAPDYDGTFRSYLELFITQIRAAGCTPILTTPVQRMYWTDGEFDYTLGEYPAAMIKVAQDNGVRLIDLAAESAATFIALGEGQRGPTDPSGTLGAYAEDEPSTDRTHFSASGGSLLGDLMFTLWPGSVP